MSELSLSTRFQNFFFNTKRQEEFLDNYLSLKNSGQKNQMPDSMVFQYIKEIYTEINSESAFEVQICDRVIEEVSRGGRLDFALAPFLDDDIVLAFKATYEVGQTEFGIRQVLKNIKQQTEMKKLFISRVRKGLVFFTIGILFVLAMSNMAIPQMLQLVSENELDALATFYLNLGKFIEQDGDKLLFGIIAFIAVYIYVLPNVYGKPREILEKSILSFLFTPYRGFVANRFFNMLTLLKSSKLSLRQSLDVIDDEVPPYLQHHLEQMLDMTRLGVSNLEQLDTGLLTPRLRIRLKSAGITGGDNIDDVFSSIASKANEDFEKSLSSTGNQISFWLLVVGLLMCAMSILVMLNIMMAVAFSM